LSDFKIFINLKTYKEGTGKKAVELAKLCQEVSESRGVEIIPIVQAVDLYLIKQTVGIPVWVQHVDQFSPGQFTGFISLETVFEAGGSGTLVNHSEHQIPPGNTRQIVARAKEKNFSTMVCCKTLGQMEKLVKFKPDYLAYEIAELIGTKDSIVEKAPKAIKHAVEICGKVPLIVGAGVHSKNDLETAKKLGAKGVLISSAIVLAEDPRQKLLELISD